MTTFNTDYNNTELLDQELTIEQLEGVAGGNAVGRYFELLGQGLLSPFTMAKHTIDAFSKMRITFD